MSKKNVIDMANASGERLGDRYRIISKLGEGGMGVAYRAWDDQKGRPVVIKCPKKRFLEDPGLGERFLREIRLLQGLSHPHIVPIIDVGQHEGLPFVVMRFLPGGSLSNRRLRDADGKPRPNPVGMLHLWLPAVAEALDHVHANGVVHRDVKPGNIFFDAFWGAYLGDFGAGKIVEESEAFDKELTLTATHMGIGTSEYMTPEQFMMEKNIDGRADQYALAVIVYEMVSGSRPFTGISTRLAIDVMTQPVPPLQSRRRDLPVSLVEAVHRGLAKTPADRFPNCRAFAAAVLRDVQTLELETEVARLLCPNLDCRNIIKLPTEAAGREGKCRKCRGRMMVAEDLGALWLLDEARKREASAPDSEANGEAPTPEESVATPTEEGLDEFQPISSPTPIPKPDGSQKKPSPLAIVVGVVAAVLVAGVTWFATSDNGSAPPAPPTYESKLASAMKKLANKPSDPAANEFVGRHLCFRERKWSEALPYLARSNAFGISTLAEKEEAIGTARPESAGAFVRVAEDWWRLADRKEIGKPEEVAVIRDHAADLYLKNMGLLTAESDITSANHWLDSDQTFRRRVDDKRPPGPVSKPPIYLADMPVKRSGVGWGQLRMGRLPDVKVNEKVFDKVIFAHAPSLVVFDLPDGFDGTLQGSVGIAGLTKANAAPSSCRFRILGDDSLLWQSGVIDQDKTTGGSVLERFKV